MNKKTTSLDVAEYILTLCQKSKGMNLTSFLDLQLLLYSLYGVYLVKTGKPLFDNELPHISGGNILFPSVSKIYNNIVKPCITEIDTYKFNGHCPEELKEFDLIYFLNNQEAIYSFEEVTDVVIHYCEDAIVVSDQITHKAFLPFPDCLVPKSQEKMLEDE